MGWDYTMGGMSDMIESNECDFSTVVCVPSVSPCSMDGVDATISSSVVYHTVIIQMNAHFYQIDFTPAFHNNCRL